MKTFFKLTLALLMFFSLDTFAQESIIGEVNYKDLEKYITLARQNFPRKQLLDTRVEGAHTAIPINTLSYLDIFSASYFYRPDNNPVITAPGVPNANPYSVNGVQLGINLNLGSFLAKPYLGKRAKAEYKIAKLEAEEYGNTLVVEVKKRYYAYIQQITQLKINTQSVQDNKNVADNLKYKFEKGEISLDTYNQSRINLSSALTSKIQSEVSLLTAKDALEEIIGMKLSDVK
ncbi:TolC family protein [Pedobacter gandavensis]|uniref:TolC family protein n=1 Tax=Pedobacter gandavensis TaxID=2679963 RepID=UPI00292CF5D2|nr:TolC family protein [Pedobacter gandavensis]